MGSTGLITLKEIIAILDDCAPGAVIESKVHKNWVLWNGKIAALASRTVPEPLRPTSPAKAI